MSSNRAVCIHSLKLPQSLEVPIRIRKVVANIQDNSSASTIPVFEVGLVSEASGSGFVEHGSTKVVAAVFGPREVTRRKEFSLQAQLR